MSTEPWVPGALGTPGLWRRLACFVYEGMLLFGVVMIAGLIYGLVTQQRHALVGAFGLRVFLFVVLGAYFIGFWSRSGQTLAMQTWPTPWSSPRPVRWTSCARARTPRRCVAG